MSSDNGLQLPIRPYPLIRMDHHGAPPLSPAYVPDPVKWDEHVPVYVLEPEHPEYHVPTDDDIQVEDQPYADDASLTAESPGHIADSESMEEDSIDYLDEPEDEDEDPKEDPKEDHTDDLSDGEDDDDKPSDDGDDDDDTDDEDEEPTEDEEDEEHIALADSSAVPVVDHIPSAEDTEAFETDESAPTPRSPQTRIPFSQTRICKTRKTVRLEPPMSASIEARIVEHATAPIPPTSSAYDQAPLGHRETMISMRYDIPEEDMPPRRRFVLTAPPPGCDVAKSYAAAAARPPRGQYDFVDTVKVGQGLIRSPGHDARTIARAADRVEDVGYVRDLQASEYRMMTSIEEVNLRVSYQAQIDVVRGHRTAYKTELHEVCQAYLSSEARNRALLARLETLETHMSRMEIMPITRQGANDTMTPESIQAMIDWAIQRNSTHTQDDASQSSGGGLRRPVQPACVYSYIDFMKCQPLNFKGTEGVRGNDVAAYTQRFQELALMCTKFLVDETEKVDKYISGLPDNIHGNVMSARPKTLDDAIELANDLMDQKLRTYAERHNDNKRKADDSSRNNQQPHKKKNVSRAYTTGPGEKKAYTGNLPLCTKCNYHHTRQCAPMCGNCKRYGHATNDCQANTNNNNNNNSNKNQKAGACYECGNTGHIKKNCPKLKNHENSNENGTTQGRASALGGRDASSNSNVITDCTLNFMNHPFNIDLMPVPLSSFDVIIGMDWLTKNHGVIICDEKIVRVPFGREMLIFQGNGNNQREESRLNIISCTKAQLYFLKGCDVFLAHITTKEAKDKSEGKRLEDVPIVRDFPEVFPEDLPGIPPARQVEFQIDLVPGAAPVA
ncbi:putative reverse transcriptase domain-containing protein [Tanacetum coccineum]